MSHVLLLFVAVAPAFSAEETAVEQVTKSVRVVRGAINGVLVSHSDKTLAIYGDPREQPAAVDTVLFTHSRRDVVWAGRSLVQAGAKAIVPAAEAAQMTDVGKFWSDFESQRFHDYSQQTSKVLAAPLPVSQSVREGEDLTWNDLPIQVLDTPGYSRGSITYLLEMDGTRIAFTGDLIFGDGQLFDLYSLQDAIPEAKIGGYHGYAARLAQTIDSLRKVASRRPAVIVPARGRIITDPDRAIATLIARIQKLYENYLSTDALRWYFHDDHIMAKAKRVLGPDAKVEWMPAAQTVCDLPAWVVPIDNARLIISADKTGLLIDCGSQHILDEIKKLQTAGKVNQIEHIFITHYHDDHTNQVAKAAELFGATVHASRENWEILENPSAYRLPCLTANPVHVSGRDSDGSSWKWKEFDIRLFYFPGQTLNHDALLVKKDDGQQIFFIGDSFTPCGIDDYCLQNRNFVREGEGFLRCLDTVKREAPEALLVNQHVLPAFRFSDSQIDRMKAALGQRERLLATLLPWDDPNFGLDEGWARFHPYACSVGVGGKVSLALRILNHSPSEKLYRVRLHLPDACTLISATPNPIRIPAHSEGSVGITMEVAKTAVPELRVVTADLQWDGWDLREWTEAIVRVESK